MSPLTQPSTCVLVVDDEPTDRERVRRWLGESVSVVEAGCGADALRLASERHPECVLLDYHLPDAECVDLLDRLGADGCGVVVLTGHGTEEIVAEVMKHGASDYIAKGMLTRSSLERIVQTSVNTARLRKRIQAQQQEFRCFAHTAAHDLRAPLRRIDQWTAILAEQHAPKLDDEGRQCVARIRAGVRDMNALISGLLDYARMQEPLADARPLELGPVVRHALTNLQRIVDETRAEVRVGALPAVRGHATALELLFQNLIGNALKFHQGVPHVEVSARLDGSSWILTVADDGIGIDPDQLERIFQPFERAVGRGSFEGSGLGLATCARIVAAHGGVIWAEATPGRGSRFHVRLPVCTECDEALADGAAARGGDGAAGTLNR